jgi:hypothetical protein
MVPPGTARQPSLFGVQASDPTPDDLAGLLAGPGQLHRMGGTARVSVTVDAGWRVHVLIGELSRRSLPASWEPVDGSPQFTVRTAYTTRLLGLARSWQAGAPPGLHLNGQALRLWVAAAGQPAQPDGYLLALGPAGEPSWSAVGAALSAAGLAAALVVPGAPGRARDEAVPGAGGEVRAGAGPGAAAARSAGYRITGRRRLARLAELVGDPPETAPPDRWPLAPTRRS